MTKVIKWYKKYNTWQTVISVLSPIAGGEVVAFFTGFALPTWVHVTVGFIAVALFYLRMFAVDKNGNGIIDSFEKKPD